MPELEAPFCDHPPPRPIICRRPSRRLVAVPNGNVDAGAQLDSFTGVVSDDALPDKPDVRALTGRGLAHPGSTRRRLFDAREDVVDVVVRGQRGTA
jgi:hypothetical protein